MVLKIGNGRLAWIVIGLSNSGKTYLVKQVLRKELIPRFIVKDKQGDSQCNIFIMSPSLSLSGDFKEFEDVLPDHHTEHRKQRLFDCYDEGVIQELFGAQKALIKKHGKESAPEVMIILDDCIDYLHNSKVINALFTRGRHYKISVCLITQKFKSLNRTIRVNAALQTFFRCSNSSEIEQFCEEAVGRRYKDEFYQASEELFKKPYTFIHVDYNEEDFKRRFGLGDNCNIIGYF